MFHGNGKKAGTQMALVRQRDRPGLTTDIDRESEMARRITLGFRMYRNEIYELL